MPGRGGPSSGVPGVAFGNAYRFSTRTKTEGEPLEGFVFKVGPRYQSWEARIDGTPIAVRCETRKEAVELAIRQARSGA